MRFDFGLLNIWSFRGPVGGIATFRKRVGPSRKDRLLTLHVGTLEERAEFRLVCLFLWIFSSHRRSRIVGEEPRRLCLNSQL